MPFESKIKEKTWSPKIEPEIFKKWEEETRPFSPDASDLPVFVIDTPPPYPSGRPWHIGAAAHYSQIDMIARTASMSGHNVLFPIGIDRNGLPVELYTERKYKVRIHETPREKFLELCRHALDDLEAEMIQIMKTMGLSGDLKHYYRTDSEEYRCLTQATFITLWKSGLVYQASRPNNYCVDCGTTIADAEVTYEDIPTELVYLHFKVEDLGDDIIVATTRPELLCACQTVIVNPDDERFQKYQGKMATVPLYGRKVLIRPHPSAKPEFGSGVVMVCSYGDYTDVLLFRELSLKEIVAIDDRGKMTEAAEKYQGLRVKKAREEVVKDLEAAGLVVKRESISHRTPMCERSHTPIEIIPMKEYYLKQLEFKPEIREIAEKMIFHPEAHRRILLNWIDSVSIDWPISRRRYYATEIPIWYCDKCGEPQVPEPGKYYQPWKDPAPFKQCSKCGGTSFTGDTRTFDTWMDSSVTPLFITRYQDNNNQKEEFFSKTYPTSLRPQAKDIVRTWLYYTILRCYQLTEKPPFQHAWIMGYGVDEKGERMSKSKGNVIDPIPILAKYGGDTFRYWSASETSLGADFRCSELRIAGCNKFLTKLWNTSRFVSSFPVPEAEEIVGDLTPSDRWILAELSKLITECMEGYRDFNFFIPANRVREFAWNIFAAHYIEMAKSRAYGSNVTEAEQKAAWYTLHTVLRSILLLLAPIVPFVTDELWRELYDGASVHKEQFPTAKWDTEAAKYTEKIVEFNEKVWFEKKSKGLSLKVPIKMAAPEQLRDFALDLKAMHHLEE